MKKYSFLSTIAEMHVFPMLSMTHSAPPGAVFWGARARRSQVRRRETLKTQESDAKQHKEATQTASSRPRISLFSGEAAREVGVQGPYRLCAPLRR